MKFGCNFSPELIEILAVDSEFIDAIKLSSEEMYLDQFERVKDGRPILLHLLPRVFSDEYMSADSIDRFNLMLKECNIRHVGIHFMQTTDSECFVESSCSELLEILITKLKMIKSKLEAEILIENMPYYALGEGFEVMANPEFIKEVCVQADVGLLLDTAHAQISAWHLGISKEHYLRKLPLDRILEVHLSGPRHEGGRYIDKHDFLLEDDYIFLMDVLSVSSPTFLTLEYGGEGEIYAEGGSDSVHILDQITKIKKAVIEAKVKSLSASVLDGV